MEEKKKIKVKFGTVASIIIIIVLLFALFGMWYYYNYVKVVDRIDANAEVANNERENKAANDEKSENKSLKIYEDKDWVYDAEYEKNVTVEEYKTGYGNTLSAQDIKVPFININSNYASNANNELKNEFDKLVKIYNNSVKSAYACEEGSIDSCEYKHYNNKDVLSVALIYGIAGTAPAIPYYYTYNFDLKTGNKLSYEEVYKAAGLNSSNIESKVQEAITKMMQSKLDVNFSGVVFGRNMDFNAYNKESIENYKKSVEDNTLKYFLSEKGELCIVVTLEIPADSGEFDTIIMVEKETGKINENISQSQEKLESTSNISNSAKELTESEKQEIFNKSVKDYMVFINEIIHNKDFNQKEFTDREIILVLPDSSEHKIFSSYGEDFEQKASIKDVEESAKKIFNKTIDVKSVQDNNFIKVINDDVVVAGKSGVGIMNAELISIDTVGTNEYKITFKFTNDSGVTDTYKLTVNYSNGNVVYESFEK